jgi:hypothetical protein
VANWHLRELEGSLANAGWRVVDVKKGNGYDVSASWEIERGGKRVVVDFEGLTEHAVALPLEEGYACKVREHPALSLYFGKKPSQSRPRGSWNRKLSAFVVGLGEVES